VVKQQSYLYVFVKFQHPAGAEKSEKQHAITGDFNNPDKRSGKEVSHHNFQTGRQHCEYQQNATQDEHNPQDFIENKACLPCQIAIHVSSPIICVIPKSGMVKAVLAEEARCLPIISF
jgi:hypothetical protein